MADGMINVWGRTSVEGMMISATHGIFAVAGVSSTGRFVKGCLGAVGPFACGQPEGKGFGGWCTPLRDWELGQRPPLHRSLITKSLVVMVHLNLECYQLQILKLGPSLFRVMVLLEDIYITLHMVLHAVKVREHIPLPSHAGRKVPFEPPVLVDTY